MVKLCSTLISAGSSMWIHSPSPHNASPFAPLAASPRAATARPARQTWPAWEAPPRGACAARSAGDGDHHRCHPDPRPQGRRRPGRGHIEPWDGDFVCFCGTRGWGLRFFLMDLLEVIWCFCLERRWPVLVFGGAWYSWPAEHGEKKDEELTQSWESSTKYADRQLAVAY